MWPFKRRCRAFDLGGYHHKVLCRERAVADGLCARHLAERDARR